MKVLLASVVGLFVVSASAFGAESEKDGFLIGFNLGAGQLRDDNLIATKDSTSGFNGSFYAGGSLTPNVAVMGLYDGLVTSEEISGYDVTISNGFLGAVGQYSMDRFFVRSGLGFAMTRAEVTVLGVKVSGDRSGFGAYLNPGVELYQSGKFAIDVSAKFIPQWYKDSEGGFAYSYGGGLGFTWY